VFGGLCTRSGWLFVAQGAAGGCVTAVLMSTLEARRRLALRDEEGRPVLAAGIAVGPTYTLHVADPFRRVVRLLSLFGNACGRFGEPADGRDPIAPDRRGVLAEPCAVAVDEGGSAYVASAGGPRVYAVQKYSRGGRYLGSFRSFGVPGETFCSPHGIAVRDDKVYVADSGNGAIQVFRRDGGFVQAYSTAVRAGERSIPVSIALEPSGSLLVLDRGDGASLRRLAPGGEVLATLLAREDVDAPISVASGGGGFFVLDRDGDRLRAFAPDGSLRADLTRLLESRVRAGASLSGAYRRGL
jgi:NHL repeat-containing protein